MQRNKSQYSTLLQQFEAARLCNTHSSLTVTAGRRWRHSRTDMTMRAPTIGESMRHYGGTSKPSVLDILQKPRQRYHRRRCRGQTQHVAERHLGVAVAERLQCDMLHT